MLAMPLNMFEPLSNKNEVARNVRIWRMRCQLPSDGMGTPSNTTAMAAITTADVTVIK